jgi:hypothetical protein
LGCACKGLGLSWPHLPCSCGVVVHNCMITAALGPTPKISFYFWGKLYHCFLVGNGARHKRASGAHLTSKGFLGLPFAFIFIHLYSLVSCACAYIGSMCMCFRAFLCFLLPSGASDCPTALLMQLTKCWIAYAMSTVQAQWALCSRHCSAWLRHMWGAVQKRSCRCVCVCIAECELDVAVYCM